MNVLVACEESQAVTIELRKLGHNAFSCDLQNCSGGHPEWHLKMDVFKALELMKWDLIIMHPPCTAIAVSGNSTYAIGMPKYNERIEAVKWTQKLWDKAISLCDKVCLENPVGVLNTMGNFPKPQYIQPYYFGDPHPKKTGLQLYGLPKLKPTNIVEPEFIIGKRDGKKYSKIHYMSVSMANGERGKLRSKTFPGIAKALAEQFTKANNIYVQKTLFDAK